MNTTTKIKSIEELTKNGYYYVNNNITNNNFPAPESFETEAYRFIPLEKYASSEECLKIIKKAGCRPSTIHELALLKENHPEEFVRGKWHLAIGSVWTDAVGRRKVPGVLASADGDFMFRLGDWDGGWFAGLVLVCFCDKKPSGALALDEDLGSLDSSEPSPRKEDVCIKYLKSKGYAITKIF